MRSRSEIVRVLILTTAPILSATTRGSVLSLGLRPIIHLLLGQLAILERQVGQNGVAIRKLGRVSQMSFLILRAHYLVSEGVIERQNFTYAVFLIFFCENLSNPDQTLLTVNMATRKGQGFIHS